MSVSDQLVRWRVSLSWILGLGALYLADPSPALFSAGVGVGLLGQLLRLWAAGHLEKNSGLTTSGPYARTRNPLYLGSMLMGLGFVLAAGRWELGIVFTGLLLGVFLPVIRKEAAHLGEKYPELYGQFAAEVPLLVPRLSPGSPLGEPRDFSWRRVQANGEHVTVIGWVLVVAVLGWKLL